jgi:hypothetical protein
MVVGLDYFLAFLLYFWGDYSRGRGREIDGMKRSSKLYIRLESIYVNSIYPKQGAHLETSGFTGVENTSEIIHVTSPFTAKFVFLNIS